MIIKEKAKEYLSLYLCRTRNVQDFFVGRRDEITLDGFDGTQRTYHDIDTEKAFYEICEKFSFSVPDADIKKRFAEGSHFCLVTEGGNWGCWGWYNAEPKDFYVLEIDITDRIPGDCAMLFHFFTNPDLRRRGFYFDLLRNIAVKNGKRYSVIYAYDTNPSSSAAMKKAGYRFAGRYGHKSFVGFENLIKETEV